MDTVLDRVLDEYGPRIDDAIRQCMRDVISDRDFAAKLSYPFGYVDETGHETSASSGKRFRPILCLVACEGAGGNAVDALALAAALEILHNFSLVHDDIEDQDPVRRHRPAVWKLWGEAQGINIGDALFAVAGRAVLQSSAEPARALALAQRFQDTALTLTEGQHLDMVFETRDSVTADEYVTMISKKTSSLIATSLWSGAFLAGADENTLWAMNDFGDALGKAFQIHDDILGIWAPQNATGKQRATDIQNGKKTLPILLAAEGAAHSDFAVITSYVAGYSPEVSEVIRALDSCSARARAEREMQLYVKKARLRLSEAGLRPEATHLLGALADVLTGQLASS